MLATAFAKLTITGEKTNSDSVSGILFGMSKSVLTSIAAVFVISAQLVAQSHSAFPADISSGPAPRAVAAGGKTWLVYELRLTNVSSSQIEFLQFDALGANDTVLASYRDAELDKLLVLLGAAQNEQKARSIPGGRSVIIFVNLALNKGAAVPTELRHRFRLSIPARKDGTGGSIENTITGAPISVMKGSPPLLHPPLSGAHWVAFNSLGGDDHRRAAQAIDGKLTIAQRFAIDWMQLGPDGRLFHGDSQSNSNFYGYGAEVLAVADATVCDLKDGLPEYSGSNQADSRKITLDNVVGNYITLDLGNQSFALYAHLVPGSLLVKVGDKVKAGQPIAKLGNSGNSDAPHLHFHLVNANSPLAAEGIPYELDHFTQTGFVSGPEILDKGEPWHADSAKAPIDVHHEFPVNNAVVSFQ